jgi:hypothetical protein
MTSSGSYIDPNSITGQPLYSRNQTIFYKSGNPKLHECKLIVPRVTFQLLDRIVNTTMTSAIGGPESYQNLIEDTILSFDDQIRAGKVFYWSPS